MNRRVAVYAGSFDPVHNGHLDIVARCRPIFDEVIVAVLHNEEKAPLFTVEERVEMIRELVGGNGFCRVESFSGLLVDFMERAGARTIVRGLRAVSDFEYEFQMALMNRKLNRDIQTVFMMTGLRWIFTSSTIIKEAAKFGGDIEEMVPPLVNRKLKEKAARSGGTV